ncbi:hypothetical protein [Actinoplanes sp. M2I2]|uniref:hypothetical protein n=1 Tax=Actinoplanes sp. M2I2 TaxID=1734444 RepID=UPI002021CB25|nr:hypothetical protein [Actinoplanes sp. M2I2]
MTGRSHGGRPALALWMLVAVADLAILAAAVGTLVLFTIVAVLAVAVGAVVAARLMLARRAAPVAAESVVRRRAQGA